MVRFFSGFCIVLALLFSLTGCSILPEPGDPPQCVYLTPPPTFSLKENPFFPVQLVISRPQADSIWNTERLSLRKSPCFVDYYAGLSWTDRLPIVLQTLLLETFEKTHCFKSVERTSLGVGPQYVLRTEIRSFWADYSTGTPPFVEIVLKVDLFNPENHHILKSAVLTANKQATADTVEGVITAFTAATQDILQKIVIWTIAKPLQNDPEKKI